jgi:hypothetical protein
MEISYKTNIKIFVGIYVENGESSQEIEDGLTFKRKLSNSLENRAAVITVPRAIA